MSTEYLERNFGFFFVLYKVSSFLQKKKQEPIGKAKLADGRFYYKQSRKSTCDEPV